ncbi:rRNA methyltransferase [Acrocarpospora phusangensis]|uniref:rRNA methyltransferase n=1 Tax=Acrocarpospora phusangensis TaxID=1070424 RepID=A0A919Q7Z9_9ACTN|nr:small ribosomal subunit Rsm22 family protein [Acrocarpospora phusangensis]GIH23663.1 rRNA methyltransferase [Acrocarpospora phusangensis]
MTVTATLPGDLSDALDAVLRRFAPAQIARSVQSLMGQYRDGAPPAEVILRSEIDVAAYAAYRMPATFAAVSAALRHTAELAPGFAPRTQVDVGGGTGASVWAAADVWGSLEKVTVLEQSPYAISMGEWLASRSRTPVVRSGQWSRGVIHRAVDKPPADLVTMSYVLGELPADAQEAVVRSLAGDAGMVVLIEPGTPAGYARILAARDVLINQGMSVVAPCPHDLACPITLGRDWCHFSVRLNRTALHRQIKVGTLSFEDEKFSYVAAANRPWTRASNRVLRHPTQRKGLVSMRLCTGEPGLTDEIVSKRRRDLYQRARDISWGNQWPPPG